VATANPESSARARGMMIHISGCQCVLHKVLQCVAALSSHILRCIQTRTRITVTASHPKSYLASFIGCRWETGYSRADVSAELICVSGAHWFVPAFRGNSKGTEEAIIIW
jgi:hypothetical protein